MNLRTEIVSLSYKIFYLLKISIKKYNNKDDEMYKYVVNAGKSAFQEKKNIRKNLQHLPKYNCTACSTKDYLRLLVYFATRGK